jgi:hypothetical protein
LESIPSSIKRALTLIPLLPVLIQPLFYHTLNTGEHPNLLLTIASLLQEAVDLKEQELVGLAFAAVILGHSSW